MLLDGKRFAATGAFQGGVHGDILQANQDNVVPTTDGLDNVRRSIELAAGPHAIEIKTSPDTSNSPVQLRLNWYTPEQRAADHDHAIAAAKSAKVAVVFLWTRLAPVFGLPGDQDKLVDEVAAVNPNTIVVLNTSQPVALPWVDKVKAVLEMWWPGDEGGWSTANLLLGKVSPAGRLPVTWGKNLTDYPATDPKHPERSKKGVDKKTTYSEGVNVGYRWFDKQNIEPLFAFGHGLSYTTFDYSGLGVLKDSDGGLDVDLNIKNTGSDGLRRSAAGLLRPAQRDSGWSPVPGARSRSLRSHPSCRGRIEDPDPPRPPAPTSVLVHERRQVGDSVRSTHRQRRRLVPRPPPQPDHRVIALTARRCTISCPILSPPVMQRGGPPLPPSRIVSRKSWPQPFARARLHSYPGHGVLKRHDFQSCRNRPKRSTGTG